IPKQVPADDRPWFLRPTDDSKEIAGGVKSGREIVEIAQKVLALPEDDLPRGSLNHQSELMLCPPAHINAEWRLWVVDDVVVTWSLYRFGPRVVYRPEIDDDALAFARDLVAANPRYAPAYVMDVCRTTDGLRMLETNCLNAAGFYAADLNKLVMALEDLSSRTGTWT
ncbi:MAG: ATP-grasp domain-containing protein, partial [Pseudomonadota bacterium]